MTVTHEYQPEFLRWLKLSECFPNHKKFRSRQSLPKAALGHSGRLPLFALTRRAALLASCKLLRPCDIPAKPIAPFATLGVHEQSRSLGHRRISRSAVARRMCPGGQSAAADPLDARTGA